MRSRRSFMQYAAGTAAILGSHAAFAKPAKKPAHKFQLRYAPHFGMFKEHAGEDLVAQLEFMADQGFTALEDNGLMGRPVEVQERIGETLARLGMTMGVFVIDGGDNWKTSLATGKAEFRDKFLATCRDGRGSGQTRQCALGHGGARAISNASCRSASRPGNVIDIAARGRRDPRACTTSPWCSSRSRDNPDLFLRTSDQAYAICRAVDSPACKILYDMYHMQRNEGDIIAHIDLAWSEIAYFQIGDNPGRKEPGTGEMNYKNLFRHIRAQGVRRRVRHGARQREARARKASRR